VEKRIFPLERKQTAYITVPCVTAPACIMLMYIILHCFEAVAVAADVAVS